jgi:hypothetical protein
MLDTCIRTLNFSASLFSTVTPEMTEGERKSLSMDETALELMSPMANEVCDSVILILTLHLALGYLQITDLLNP